MILLQEKRPCNTKTDIFMHFPEVYDNFYLNFTLILFKRKGKYPYKLTFFDKYGIIVPILRGDRYAKYNISNEHF